MDARSTFRRLTLLLVPTLLLLVLPAPAALAAAPTITGFSPLSGPVGTTVVISGSNFTAASEVTFWPNRSATATVNNPNQITTTVPVNAHTGPISVTTADGTATSADDFVVTATTAPSITSFTPSSGAVGTTVRISGANLDGATSVKFFNNVSASFTVDSSVQITATVPSGATTGPITVTTPNGSDTSSSNFTVATPEITSFDPVRGPWGTTVVITGVGLSGATAVRFGGTSAASFTVDSSTKITARVANGTTTGRITVTVPSGTLTSGEDFAIQHFRTISLSLSGNLTASGRVTCVDGSTACAQSVPIKIQRRVDGVWKTVGTDSTDGAGNYGIHVPDKAGKFRAVAPKTSLSNGDRCPRAKSSVVLN